MLLKRASARASCSTTADGLSVAQTAAIASAVLADPVLNARVSVKLPASLFGESGLPREALTTLPATFYRDAACDKGAYLVTTLGGDEDQSLQDMSRLGVAELLERLPLWVAAVEADLGLDDASRVVFERALAGLSQLRATSLDRFAGYVLRVSAACTVDGHPLVNALGAALPALQLPNDPTAFTSIKERSRRHTSAWQREFANLTRRRKGLLLKETQTQLVLNEDDLRAAFAKTRDAIPECHHATIEAFIGTHHRADQIR